MCHVVLTGEHLSLSTGGTAQNNLPEIRTPTHSLTELFYYQICETRSQVNLCELERFDCNVLYTYCDEIKVVGIPFTYKYTTCACGLFHCTNYIPSTCLIGSTVNWVIIWPYSCMTLLLTITSELYMYTCRSTSYMNMLLVKFLGVHVTVHLCNIHVFHVQVQCTCTYTCTRLHLIHVLVQQFQVNTFLSLNIYIYVQQHTIHVHIVKYM